MEAAAVAERIAQLELLSSLPPDMHGQLADVFLDVSDILHFDDGETLINEGYLSFDTGYVLLDGKASVDLPDEDPLEIEAPVLIGEMAQFRSADIRSATVRARGEAVAAQFYWEDLYKVAEAQLPEEAHLAFRKAVELQIWERFEFRDVLTLPLLGDLSEELRLRVCLPFPSIAERIRLQGVDTLFNQGTLCKSTGYLLVKGELKLFRKEEGEKVISAPNIIGIFPGTNEKGTEWTATAMVKGEAEVLKFSWDTYTEQLTQRLTRDEQKAYVTSLKKNSAKHFWH